MDRFGPYCSKQCFKMPILLLFVNDMKATNLASLCPLSLCEECYLINVRNIYSCCRFLMQPHASGSSGVFVLEQHIDYANPSVIQSVWCLWVSCFWYIVWNRKDMKNIILSSVIFTLTSSSCSIPCLYKTSLPIVYSRVQFDTIWKPL